MSEESIRVPLTGLGKVHDFQGDTISHFIAFAEVKLGAGTVEGRQLTWTCSGSKARSRENRSMGMSVLPWQAGARRVSQPATPGQCRGR
jgi:hypothetical protein